jgi:hypothetical protein
VFIRNYGARTFLGGGVDIEAQFLHQEPADVEVVPGRGGVQRVPALVALGFPQVHLPRHHWLTRRNWGNITINTRTGTEKRQPKSSEKAGVIRIKKLTLAST